MKKYLIILGLAFTLQGCIFVAGAAAGAAAIAVVYDHRKVEQIIEDQTIANRIQDNFNHHCDLKNKTHINVTSFNRIVLLTGEAPSVTLSQKAKALAESTSNVKRVYNQICITNPSSSFSRANDTWISTKIKAQMLATQNLKSGSIKVITENGNVYLMGIVTRDQANIATDIARQVSGVQRVLKVFQYRN